MDQQGVGTTYTVFQLQSQPSMCCAIPEGGKPPSFIGEPGWQEIGSLNEPDAPPDFDRHIARFAVGFQGFYVFRWHDAPMRQRESGDLT
jgi:hypothetical protein